MKTDYQVGREALNWLDHHGDPRPPADITVRHLEAVTVALMRRGIPAAYRWVELEHPTLLAEALRDMAHELLALPEVCGV